MKFLNFVFISGVFGRAIEIYDLHNIYNLCIKGLLLNDKRYAQLMASTQSDNFYSLENACDKYINLIMKRKDLKPKPSQIAPTEQDFEKIMRL
ncbi:Oidioi.mRNA.OKI2018_I69.chr1.g740.t1.cds [Oikopleura dioica]|uniref:Oidioi.mRNA.OKI2018_I69.chr1.g740.t1.cds n=1 Tax=Oikopleura dioica TaxID=34765 RepID=A0ABN7SV06_OIKDI|nr:Oidioi.mRNA.OKI2018_I69.chr1.g740.t1.cds [Oikopleura dioica]